MADPLVLAHAHQSAILRIRARAQAAVDGIWSDLAGVSDVELAGFLDQITPIVQGARLASVNVTAGYLRRFVQLTDGITPDVADFVAADIAGNIRNGAALDEVYARPIITARAALSRGAGYMDAMRQGRERLDTTVATDVQLGMRDAAYEYGRRVPQIRAWRRVLQGGKVCALCVVASTQVYRTGDLMPIHPNCDCGVVPETESYVPRDVNEQRLRDAREFSGEAYRAYRPTDANGDRVPHPMTGIHGYVDEDGTVRFGTPSDPESVKAFLPDATVEQHGELGPTLVTADHHFTGPDEVG